MTKPIALFASFLALTIVGCRRSQPAPGPVEGSVVTSDMPIEEQIKKVEADKSIPESYKQTYINSLRQKAAQQGAGK